MDGKTFAVPTGDFSWIDESDMALSFLTIAWIAAAEAALSCRGLSMMTVLV